MPILFNEKFEGDCELGIWEITESYDELLSRVHLFPGERDRLESFRSDARKVEFLSVRALLKELLGRSVQIVYNDKRKPYLTQCEYRISISHSRNLTGIMLSKEKKVGLDMEFMSHKIGDIESKFINDDEKITDDPELRKYHLYIHWCAKEALYKICDKQDINFRKNLTIEAFEPQPCGRIVGWVDNRFWHDKFPLHYFTINNYVVAYCCKTL